MQKDAIFEDQHDKNARSTLTSCGVVVASGICALIAPQIFFPAMIVSSGGLLNASAGLYEQNRIIKNIQCNKQLQLKRNAERIDALTSITVPFLIEIEPISEPSQIDDRVLVSKFRWAVTLICRNGSEGNHASVIVEGLNNGEFDDLNKCLCL